MSSRNFSSIGLIPLSWCYWLGLHLNRLCKKIFQIALPKPVVSVGNLTLGGTGKTPLLLKLTVDLLEAGIKPAILTRGYRGLGKRIFPAVIQKDSQNDVPLSDEVELMVSKLPTVPIGVGKDRTTSAELIQNKSPVDVFLLDDGFQHWKLHRSMDLVCVDATRPLNKDHLFPWGHLREPLIGLQRASAVILTRMELLSDFQALELRNFVHQLAPTSKIISTSFEFGLRGWNNERMDLNFLKDKTVLAVSGLGNPQAFENNLSRLGARVRSMRFPDHHAYTDSDTAAILRRVELLDSWIVTTEKDVVKLMKTDWRERVNAPKQLFVLEMSTRIAPADQDIWSELIYEIKNFSIHS